MSIVGRLVAVRYLDGRVLKGWTADFKPLCSFFLVRHEDGTSTRVDTRELKALFFIKSMSGNPRHREDKKFGKRTVGGKEVWVEFNDGEELAGWSSAFASGKSGFYFAPTDPDSNAERVFVFHSALRQFRVGPAAVQASTSHDNNSPASSKPSSAGSGSGSGAGKVYEID
jgi:hypothetical protein